MAYDADAFKLGFAVGRLLWQPPAKERVTAMLRSMGIDPEQLEDLEEEPDDPGER